MAAQHVVLPNGVEIRGWKITTNKGSIGAHGDLKVYVTQRYDSLLTRKLGRKNWTRDFPRHDVWSDLVKTNSRQWFFDGI